MVGHSFLFILQCSQQWIPWERFPIQACGWFCSTIFCEGIAPVNRFLWSSGKHPQISHPCRTLHLGICKGKKFSIKYFSYIRVYVCRIDLLREILNSSFCWWVILFNHFMCLSLSLCVYFYCFMYSNVFNQILKRNMLIFF